MKAILILLWGIIIPFNLYSNDSIKTKNSLFGLQTGYGFYRYIDPLESADVYGGVYIPLNFSWITFSEKHIDELRFSYSNIAPKPTLARDVNLTDLKVKYFNVNYGYNLSIYNYKKISVFAGVNVNTYLAFRNINFYIISPINSTFVYQNRDAYASLCLSLVSKINLGNNLLFIHINNSAFGYITNRRYDLNGSSEADFLFFPKFNYYSFRLNYFYNVTRNLYLNLNYQFCYYRYPRSEDILITKRGHNQLVAGINLKF